MVDRVVNKLSVIVSSTRPTRIGPKVAEWVAAQAPSDQWEVQVVDVKGLPFMDEEAMPRTGVYTQPHTLEWAKTIAESDAVLVVTPQYNRSYPAPIKNAIDMLYPEWEAKPIALVGYGWGGAPDSREDLAKVFGHVKAAVIGSVGLNFTEDLTPEGEITITDSVAAQLAELFESLAASQEEAAA